MGDGTQGQTLIHFCNGADVFSALLRISGFQHDVKTVQNLEIARSATDGTLLAVISAEEIDPMKSEHTAIVWC